MNYITRLATQQELQDYFKNIEDKFDATEPFYKWIDQWIDDDGNVDRDAKTFIKFKMHEMAEYHSHHTKKIPRGF